MSERDDMTVLRNDNSVTRGSLSHSSWRSGVNIEGDAHGAEAPKVLKQRFVLEERIGSGGMGSVFRAKDLRKVEARGTQPFLAVKVLNNDFRHHPEAFIALEREATKSQGLRHSNIVSIFDFDKDGDVPFITMELLQGDELAELLKVYPTGLPEDLAWQVIEGMVLGLTHAHEEGVVHADFKPGNIYVTERKVAKILDFGIARAMRLNQGGEDTDFDPSRLAALTPAYASREMLNGDNPEPRDDLYSLGVVTYMTLTGHHPYGRLPANEAAREGLKPERIKGLSRRRWRTLERCLQFNRVDRPASAAEVYEGLFGKSRWQSWSMAATAALVALSIGLVTLQDNTEITEVKEEVRQETLVDAQIRRISDLLAEPAFDENWQRILLSEVQTLRALAPVEVANGLVKTRIEALYAEHIAQVGDLEQAFGQLAAGQKFGVLTSAKDHLHARLLQLLEGLAQQPIDAAWITRTKQILSYAQMYFPASSMLAAARADLVDYLAMQMQHLLTSKDVAVADLAWQNFAQEVFDEASRSSVDAALAEALAAVEKTLMVANTKRVGNELKRELSQMVNVSCLRLDMGVVAHHVQQVTQRYPEHKRGLNTLVGERVSECVQRLSALDPDRAASLHSRAIQSFGELPQLKQHGVDPCAMSYLVGNGRQAGRGGYCADQLPGDRHGPRLVVVPGDEQIPNFAISKYEISWGEFARFCEASKRCTPIEAETLPVTGVPLDTIQAYAAWLTEQTGYTYRLPTQAEWQQVTQGAPDPNRNCRVEIGGISRGDGMLAVESGAANQFGLVNVLGNAQEIIQAMTDYFAVGGTYSDPIDMCLAETQRPVRPEGDPHTGFRLVREVS